MFYAYVMHLLHWHVLHYWPLDCPQSLLGGELADAVLFAQCHSFVVLGGGSCALPWTLYTLNERLIGLKGADMGSIVYMFEVGAVLFL